MFKLIVATVAAIASSAVALGDYTIEALQDEIVDLPGKPDSAVFRHFGGFVNVGGNKNMFYTFVESEVSPETAPVLLWTNGGPGCSGLLGFFTELGPFRPQKDGTLAANEYAWNKFANVVFIEQPVGVGFSTTGGDSISYGDDQAAVDNYNFIVGFFQKYPNYNTNKFYITSESYGGHYLPTLARELVTRGQVPNFKGLAVGNPLTYMPYRDYGALATFAGHQLIPKPLWDSYLAAKCDQVTSTVTPSVCANIEFQIERITAGFDPYALDFPVCNIASQAAGREERIAMMNQIGKAKHYMAAMRQGEAVTSRVLRGVEGDVTAPSTYFPPTYEPCGENLSTTYLNRVEVQDALHIPASFRANGVQWSSCANIDYSNEDTIASMAPVWEFLTSGSFGLDLMIYSGDDDTICSTAEAQRFLWEMKFDVKKDWAAWKVDGQVGGFLTVFSNPRGKTAGTLHFATVHGAGHLVPTTRPAQIFTLLQRFLNKEI